MKTALILRVTCFLLIINGTLSCNNQTQKVKIPKEAIPEGLKSDSHPLEVEPYRDTLHIFIDSTQFGRKNRTRLEYRVITTEKKTVANIKLYSLQGKKESLMDELTIQDVSAIFSSQKLADYNADGFKDLLFHSAEAARGANDIQTLVIFDPKRTKLIWVKNSESFPNLRYNSKLHCIDAWSVYGGEMTHFLRLKGDSLVEFASVEHYDHRIIAEVIDSKGNQRELKNISEKEMGCDFCRFVNYDPIEVLE